MTQAQVAEPGYTRAYISLLEHDHIRPSLKTLQLLAHRLKRPLSYFINGVLATSADALLLYNLSDGCLRQRRIEDAKMFLRQGFEIAKELKDRRMQGLLLKNLGWVYKLTRQFKRARLVYERAIGLLERYGEPKDLAEAIMCLGNVMCDTGRFKDAHEFYIRALRTVSDAPDSRELRFMLHHNLGKVHMGMGQQDEAFEYFTNAVKSSAETTDHYLRAIAHMGAALAFKERGDLAKALDLSTKALEMFDVRQNLEAIAGVYHNIGGIHHARGEYGKARENYLRSIEMGSQFEGASPKADSLRDLAMLCLDEGRVEAALDYGKQALDASLTCDDRSLVPQAQLALARVLKETGRTDEARTLVESALVAAEAAGAHRHLEMARQELESLK